MNTNKKESYSTKNIMPLTTNFLMDNCSKRIKARYDTIYNDIKNYNESVNKYNKIIKSKNQELKKNKKIPCINNKKTKKTNATNIYINKYNEDIEKKIYKFSDITKMLKITKKIMNTYNSK